MSAGNPIDARHVLKGLEPGDRIAAVAITGGVASDPHCADAVARVVREAIAHRGSGRFATDVVVIAIPAERRRAVEAAINATVR